MVPSASLCILFSLIEYNIIIIIFNHISLFAYLYISCFISIHIFSFQGDLVHIQWTGSNRHNNGNPAGDGQAGDAGEGRGGMA